MDRPVQVITSCKDVPELPILQFLAGRKHKKLGPATWYAGEENSVAHAMPAGTPDKVRVQTMRKLIRRDLVSGCACGCRGDYEITKKGVDYLYLAMVMKEEKRFDITVGDIGVFGHYRVKRDGVYYVATHIEMNICGYGLNYREAVEDLAKVVSLFAETMIKKGAFEDFLIERGVQYIKKKADQ